MILNSKTNNRYGSIHIKNVGKFIIFGHTIDDRKQYCHNEYSFIF